MPANVGANASARAEPSPAYSGQVTRSRIAELGALIGDPTRAQLLTLLLDGRASTVGELAAPATSRCPRPASTWAGCTPPASFRRRRRGGTATTGWPGPEAAGAAGGHAGTASPRLSQRAGRPAGQSTRYQAAAGSDALQRGQPHAVRAQVRAVLAMTTWPAVSAVALYDLLDHGPRRRARAGPGGAGRACPAGRQRHPGRWQPPAAPTQLPGLVRAPAAPGRRDWRRRCSPGCWTPAGWPGGARRGRSS